MTQEATQKPAGALERLEGLEKDLSHIKGLMHRDGQAFGFLASQQQELRQSLAGITKTVAAILKELQGKGLVSDEAILANIREIDETNEKERVQGLLQSKAIEVSESVGAGSLAVIAQSHLSKEGKITVLSEYQVMEVARLDPNSAAFKELITRKAGDSFQIPAKEGFIIVNVLEVYDKASQGGASLQDSPLASDQADTALDAQPEASAEAPTLAPEPTPATSEALPATPEPAPAPEAAPTHAAAEPAASN